MRVQKGFKWRDFFLGNQMRSMLSVESGGDHTVFQVRPAGSRCTSGRDLYVLCHESPGSEREIRRGQEEGQPGGDLSYSTLLTPARRWWEAQGVQVSGCCTELYYHILL